MATNKIPNCPPLRFPDFSDEWKQTTLGEVAEIIQSRGKSNTLYLSVESFLPNFQGIGVLQNNTQSSGVGFEPDDVLMSNIRPYLRKVWYANRCGTCSPDVLVFRSKSVIFPKFLYSIIANQSFVSYAMQGAKGVKMPRGDKQQMLVYSFSFPSLLEQKKIASFLSLIDERIEACSETIKELVNEKKALLSRLFDQSLRFPPFSDPWQPTTLGEICTIAPQIAVNNPKVENILSVRLHGKGITRTTANTLKLGATQYYLRSAGQLIYGKQNFHNGAIALISSEYDGGITSKDIPSFIISENKADARFLLIYLLREEYYKGAEIYTTGTGSKRLKEISFFALPISLPSLEEQERIANFLSLVDERIELEEALLRQYELQKRYLLQQMFV